MTVGNPENFKIKIKTGREDVDSRVPCDFTNLNLKKLLSWIDSQNISSALKAELKKSASAFPHQALPTWQKNFNRHLSKAQSRLRKANSHQKTVSEIEEIGSVHTNEMNEKRLDTVSDLINNFDSEDNVSENLPEEPNLDNTGDEVL